MAATLTITLLDDRCQARKYVAFGAPCGARMLRVGISPDLALMLASQNITINDGERLCGNASSACGVQTGMRLKQLLGVLR